MGVPTSEDMMERNWLPLLASNCVSVGRSHPSPCLRFLIYKMVLHWMTVRVTTSDSRFYLFEAYDTPDGML